MQIWSTEWQLRELSFITGRGGPSVCGGGTKIFWGSQRGGPKFFQCVKGGDQNFLLVKFGGNKNN